MARSKENIEEALKVVERCLVKAVLETKPLELALQLPCIREVLKEKLQE